MLDGLFVTLHETRQRTQDYHQRVVHLLQSRLARRSAGRASAEVLRAVGRAADHHRIASSVRSDDDVRTHVSLAIDAIDDSVFWLELLRLTTQPPTDDLDSLIREGQELAGLLAGAVPGAPRRPPAAERTVIV